MRTARGDAFWIKRSFALDIYTTGLGQIFFVICTLFGLPRWLSALVILPSLHCIVWTGTIWPYYLSRKEAKLALAYQPLLKNGGKGGGGATSAELVESSSRVGVKDTLADLLSTPDGFEAFLAYLETEFSTENLLFW